MLGGLQQDGVEVVFYTALIGERVEHVRKVVVGPERQRRVHNVEVQVGEGGVARVAQPGYPLAAPYPLSLLHLDTTRLQVGVEGVPPAADVDDHVVAPGVLQGQGGVQHARRDVGVLVHDLDDLAVGDR